LKKLLFLVLVVLMTAAGCITIAPAGESQLPTAYIDSISPTEASLGETVSFAGHGTDPDGTVVAYRWRSDIDGDLGVTETFETSSLSVGTHVVYFKVQDNNDNWSDEVRRRVTVSAGASATASAPVIGSFNASPGIIASGSPSTLSWNISGAATVTIDQGIGNVALIGTRVVSPGTTTTYTLTASNATGSVMATTQVIVSGAAPPPSGGLPVINSFGAVPPIIDAGDSTSLNWNVANATSVTIDQGVGPVASVGSTPASPAATTSYTLTATNASGWSSVTIPVVVGAALAAGEADLVILDISRDGDTIHYTIKNQGLGVAGATTSVLLVDGVVKGFDNVGSLAAGAESTESFGYSYTCSGLSDTIVVHADKDSVVDESSEANNEYSEGWMCIFFIPPPLVGSPDLVILDIWRDGDTIHYTIKNQGLGVAGATTSALVIDGVVQGFDNVDSLAAGAESTESFGYSYTCSAPSDTIVVHADKDSVIDESNEDNNAYSEDWICLFFIPPIIPIEHTVTLFSIVDENGQVMQDGSTNPYPNVGDRGTNEAIQAFLSFDISGIPAGATIKSASLDLSTGDIIGDPFAGLDWMRVYNDQYGNLGAEDFTPEFLAGAIYTYASQPVAPFSFSAFGISKLQTRVDAGAPRFQVRIQFQKYTDGDGQVDCLRFGETQLVVTYEE